MTNSFHHNYQWQPASRFYDMILAPVRWQIMQIGFDLDVFDQLQSPVTGAAVAGHLGLQSTQTGLLLDAMCSLNLLEKQDQRYWLKPNLAPYLLSQSDLSMRDALLYLSRLKQCDTDRLKTMIRTGKSNHVSTHLGDAHFWDKALASLRSFHKSMSVKMISSLLNQLPEWPQVHNFLDLGAGSEYLAQTLIEERPELLVSLFDLPTCAKKIQASLSQQQANIRVIAGDFNLDDFGQGYDLIWCSMSLYYAQNLVGVLKNIRRALNPNGLFLSLHEGLYNERTAPDAHIIGRFVSAINGRDLSFDQGVIAECMEQAGFARVESQSVDTTFGPMNLDIGYLT